MRTSVFPDRKKDICYIRRHSPGQSRNVRCLRKQNFPLSCNFQRRSQAYSSVFPKSAQKARRAVRFHSRNIAIAYVVVGLVLAIIGGTIIEKTGVGKHVQDFILEGSIAEVDGIEMSQKDRLLYAKDQMLSTLKKVWIYILVGIGIGATIHNFIPTEWIQAVLGSDKWYAVPLATILGTPMYADIFGTIPVAEALFAKGVGVGTILSFMMSVTALSLPSMIMLSKAVKPKLLFWFIFIVVIGIIIIGFTFNAFNFLFV